ncbi:MAG: hypothetical protein JNL70_14655 [Saprospiraceae bacterium]|nr:hypothetical protein [Saprospiraceae bacterium]
MKNLFYLVFILPLLASRCGGESWGYDTSRGMKPIYMPAESYDQVSLQSPRPMTQSAKIYAKGKLIFAIEQGEGVHIIDNTDSTKPQKLRFLRIFGCNDIAIKGTTMYADNFTDLITIDFSRLDSPRVVNRIKNLYPNNNGEGNFPKDYNGYFECVDEKKGKVAGWKESLLDNPQCRR